MVLKLLTASSIFKKIKNNSKCGSNKKITITTTHSQITKTDVIANIKKYAEFISKNSGIDFSKIKVNSINCGKNSRKRGNFYKDDQFVMSNIYDKHSGYKKFIVTFNTYQERIKFTEIFEI